MQAARTAEAEGSAKLVAEIEAWLAGASAGDEFEYAIGALPQWAAGPARMRGLAQADAVVLFQRRVSGVFHYFARRTQQKLAPAPQSVRPVTADQPDENVRLLKVLKRVAKAGDPCPSNRELARLAGLENGDQASYRLRVLRDRGAIRINATAWAPGRMVTIAGSGHTTGVLIEVPAHGLVARKPAHG